MSVLPIIETPDVRLRQISVPVESVNDETRTLIADMFETMYAAHGIGLAAIQVGVAQRILVIDLQEGGDDHDHQCGEEGHVHEVHRQPRVFINPEIVESSEESNIYSEGCLSVPEQYADVERPLRVKAKWLDEHGVAHEEELDGLLSTCLQHEMDHLEGILFIDHLTRLKRDMLLKKLQKMRRAG
jgi:peptide deformylase